jgi:O-acetyl-ADP-ribose deacetylase (regulator of RNase III)
MPSLTLILVDPQAAVCAALRERFASLANVEVVQGRFEQLTAYDCLVSAGNSFGLMDGGVDRAIIQHFGRDLQTRVQQLILDEYLGEQPVGTSLIVPTGNADHPFLAHTPTMRVPMPIARTDNVYLAMWAMLLVVRQHNRHGARSIGSILCPGLGTGTGKVPPDEAARQMALAYEHFLSPPQALSWGHARQRQWAIGRGGDLGQLFPPELKL